GNPAGDGDGAHDHHADDPEPRQRQRRIVGEDQREGTADGDELDEGTARGPRDGALEPEALPPRQDGCGHDQDERGGDAGEADRRCGHAASPAKKRSTGSRGSARTAASEPCWAMRPSITTTTWSAMRSSASRSWETQTAR